MKNTWNTILGIFGIMAIMVGPPFILSLFTPISGWQIVAMFAVEGVTAVGVMKVLMDYVAKNPEIKV